MRQLSFIFLFALLFTSSVFAVSQDQLDELNASIDTFAQQQSTPSTISMFSKVKFDTNTDLSNALQSLSGTWSNRQDALIHYLDNTANFDIHIGGYVNGLAFTRTINGSSTTALNGALLYADGLNLILHQGDFTLYSDFGYSVLNDGDFLPNLSNFPTPPNILTNQQLYFMYHPTQSSFYVIAGEKYIDFGQFTNVLMYNMPLTTQFFMPMGTTVELG